MGLRDVCLGGGPELKRPRTAPGALLRPPTAAAAKDDATPLSNIVVAVRVRPKNAREAEKDDPPVVKAMDEHVVVFDPNIAGDAPAASRRVPGSRRSKEIQYAFDRVFGEDTTQREVYEGTAKGLVDYVLDGYNATVFAYGATGSGKTFTMIGNEQFGQGVMVSTLSDLFQKIEERKLDDEYNVRIAYLEIYNEQIRDLLDPQGALKHPLELREDQKGDTVVSGLHYHTLNSAEKVFEMLEQGNARRSQSPTEANQNSSRSHAVLQILVEKRARGAIQQEVKLGKLSMIDLAGSERAAVTANRGKLLREGANINQSLLALGNCINALCCNKKGTFVPYRNSKLTRFLRDSLGGNCKTVMIAAVSPSQLSYEDTHNTLKYANRAKDIKTKVVANVISVQAHITEYRRKMADLQSQNEELRKKLKAMEKNETEAVEREHFSLAQAEVDRYLKAYRDIAEKTLAEDAERLQLDFDGHTQEAAVSKLREGLSEPGADAALLGERIHMAELAIQQRRQAMHQKDTVLRSLRTRLEEAASNLQKLVAEYTTSTFTRERRAYFERVRDQFEGEIRLQAARREARRSEETYKYVREHAKALAAATKTFLHAGVSISSLQRLVDEYNRFAILNAIPPHKQPVPLRELGTVFPAGTAAAPAPAPAPAPQPVSSPPPTARNARGPDALPAAPATRPPPRGGLPGADGGDAALAGGLAGDAPTPTLQGPAAESARPPLRAIVRLNNFVAEGLPPAPRGTPPAPPTPPPRASATRARPTSPASATPPRRRELAGAGGRGERRRPAPHPLVRDGEGGGGGGTGPATAGALALAQLDLAESPPRPAGAPKRMGARRPAHPSRLGAGPGARSRAAGLAPATARKEAVPPARPATGDAAAAGGARRPPLSANNMQLRVAPPAASRTLAVGAERHPVAPRLAAK
eukprot:tig00001284_g8001.t1